MALRNKLAAGLLNPCYLIACSSYCSFVKISCGVGLRKSCSILRRPHARWRKYGIECDLRVFLSKRHQEHNIV